MPCLWELIDRLNTCVCVCVFQNKESEKDAIFVILIVFDVNALYAK